MKSYRNFFFVYKGFSLITSYSIIHTDYKTVHRVITKFRVVWTARWIYIESNNYFIINIQYTTAELLISDELVHKERYTNAGISVIWDTLKPVLGRIVFKVTLFIDYVQSSRT